MEQPVLGSVAGSHSDMKRKAQRYGTQGQLMGLRDHYEEDFVFEGAWGVLYEV